MLKEMKSIKGEFVSDQSSGKTKKYTFELEIDKLKIDRKKHRIEITDSKLEKVYIYILEGGFSKINKPGTGVLYKVINYTEMSDVKKIFRMSFICIFKENHYDVECTIPEIKCQFLDKSNICAWGNCCIYQKK